MPAPRGPRKPSATGRTKRPTGGKSFGRASDAPPPTPALSLRKRTGGSDSHSASPRPATGRPSPVLRKASERPAGDRQRPSFRSGPSDRPVRSDRSERPAPRPRLAGAAGPRSSGPRSFGDKPRGRFGDDRPAQRPRRDSGADRPTRSGGRDAGGPPRSGSRPTRSFGDRPARPTSRSFDGPKRSSSSPRPSTGLKLKSGPKSESTARKISTGPKRFDADGPRPVKRSSSASFDKPIRKSSDRNPSDRKPPVRTSTDRKPPVRRSATDKPALKLAKPSKLKPGKDTAQLEEQKTVRLNKFIAGSGVSSRRKADELITQGEVTINGKVVTELGVQVKPYEDHISVSGRTISLRPRFVYLLLNKPKDTITTTSDEKDRTTVMDYVNTQERVYPVGRLDRNTTGVILLTNDGELTNRLTHPSFEIEREYLVGLDKAITKDVATKIAEGGVNIGEGDITGPAELTYAASDPTNVSLKLKEGKNREVRRIFESFGYEVTKLDRTSFAGLTHRGMSRGESRHLSPQEIHKLQNLAGIHVD